MESYRMVTSNNNQQRTGARYNLRSNTRPGGRQVQHQADQGEYCESHDQNDGIDIYAIVDSWRSYRNDATNLQQTAGLPKHPNQGIALPYQNSQSFINPYGLDPTAASFQPEGFNQIHDNSAPQCPPHQSLRVSNGQKERNIVQQTSFNPYLTTNGNFSQFAPWSRGFADEVYPSVERPQIYAAHSSSVPTYAIPGPGFQAGRFSTPRRPSPPATPPNAPAPTPEYLAQASLAPEQRTTPQRLLVILDLNGTLLKRGRYQKTNYALRPGVTHLIDYLFANHVVMVYTSSRPENASGIVNNLFSPEQRKLLVAIWARDKLDLNQKQYYSKVQVYKKLEKIWADEIIQQSACDGRAWNQSNTVLIDDSHLKALAQPYNLLRVEEFLNDCPIKPNSRSKDEKDMDALIAWSNAQQQIVKDLENKLEGLKWTQDVSQLIRKWQLSDTDQQPPVNSQSIELELTQLLTPKSPDPDTSDDDTSDSGVDTRENAIKDLATKISHSPTSINDCNIYEDGSDRSASPIPESVWKDILEGVERGNDEPPTPRSMDG